MPRNKEEIKKDVVDQLYWDSRVNAADVKVSVEGALNIVNKIAVVPTEDLVDESIAEDVVRALSRSSLVGAEAIEVTVQDGYV
jgi:osmotically-inducible protein OsmY